MHVSDCRRVLSFFRTFSQLIFPKTFLLKKAEGRHKKVRGKRDRERMKKREGLIYTVT